MLLTRHCGLVGIMVSSYVDLGQSTPPHQSNLSPMSSSVSIFGTDNYLSFLSCENCRVMIALQMVLFFIQILYFTDSLTATNFLNSNTDKKIFDYCKFENNKSKNESPCKYASVVSC